MDKNHSPASRPGRCWQTLTINGLHYVVRPVVSQDDAASRAFRLSRNGEIFDAARTIHGLVCDCPDFVFRRNGRDPRGCLHIRAMLAVGLLDWHRDRLRDPRLPQDGDLGLRSIHRDLE
jgi:hypothetical protein